MSADQSRGKGRDWKQKPCGCVKADLPQTGQIAIRCKRHRHKPANTRLLCHFDDAGIVRRG